MGSDQPWDATLWVIENSGRPVIFELKALFGHQILFFNEY